MHSLFSLTNAPLYKNLLLNYIFSKQNVIKSPYYVYNLYTKTII